MWEHVMRVGKGHVMKLPGAGSDCRISCISGILWLTRENDLKDYIITAGIRRLLKGPGLTVIEAVTDCTFSITPCGEGNMHDIS